MAKMRAKKRAVTDAATSVAAAAAFDAAGQCSKCSNGVVCTDCARLRDKILERFRLPENRAGHLNRQDIVSGGYNAIKVDRVLPAHNDELQLAVELSVDRDYELFINTAWDLAKRAWKMFPGLSRDGAVKVGIKRALEKFSAPERK